MVKKIICLFTVLFCLSSGISADNRPKVGLVLAGGGALGFAHIGVLKVLEDNGIHVDYIAGTSMGGIIGALSAYGYSAREIEKEVNAIDWLELFFDNKNRDFQSYTSKTADAKYFMTLGFNRHGLQMGQGIISGQRIQNKFYHLVGPCSSSDDFDDLPTPFRCVATDIITGKKVVLKNGSLVDAMRSTMSIPGIFTPVERDGYLLVDGMVADNLPVDVAREMGADIIIAVTLSHNIASPEELKGPTGVANQMLNLYIYDQVQNQLKDADITIAPELAKYTSTSYFNFKEIVALGEAAAKEALPHIKEQVGAANISNIPKIGVMKKKPVIIDKIKVSELEPYERSIFIKKLEPFEGQLLDVDALNDVILDFHSSGQYESIRYYINTVDDTNILYIQVEPTKKGPHFFRTGIFYEQNTNVHEDYIFNLLLGLEFNDLIFPGDRLENEFEFFSGIAADTRYFVPFLDYFFIRPEVGIMYKPEQNGGFDFSFVKDEDMKEEQFAVASSISIGTFNRMFGEISVGFMNEYRYYDFNLSDVYEEEFRGIINSIFFRSRMDNINSVVLPEKGNFIELSLKYSSRFMGSEDTYLKGKATFWQYFHFLKRNSIGARLFAGMDFGTDLPIYEMEWFTYVNAFPGCSNKEQISPNIVGGVLDYKFKLFDIRTGTSKSKLLLTLRGGLAYKYEDFDLFIGKDVYDIYGFGVGLGLANPRLPIWLEGSWNDDKRFMFHISAGNKF